MRFLKYICLFIMLSGCDSENASDCFISTGTLETVSYDLDDFSMVTIFEGIELELRQGLENNIEISYAKNLLGQIETTIENNSLSIVNKASCQLLRAFKPAKVTLTAIDINQLRNASQYTVTSNTALTFETLTLISENAQTDYVNVGDFDLKIDNLNLNIISNNVSNFSIEGTTSNLFVGFYAGQSLFKGENLKANKVEIFHRGQNEIRVYPLAEIKGQIRASGNVIAFYRPAIIQVEQFYTGKLIFRE